MTVSSRCAVPQVRSRKAGIRDISCPGWVTHVLDDVPMCTVHAVQRARNLSLDRIASTQRAQRLLVDSDDPETAEIAATTVAYLDRVLEHRRQHGAT